MIIGIDEAGRGPWAGPMVIGAVSLSGTISGLKDSKKLTFIKRQQLFKEIIDQSIYGIGWVSPREIDAYGLTKSTKLGITRALEAFDSETIKDIIIDGNINYLNSTDWPMSRCMVNADATEPCVMAASVLAKVSRDNYMIQIASKYPNFGFEKHKGYGTNIHVMALSKFGICCEHRLSFKPIKDFIKT